jgi:hypothetical protein
MRQRISSLTDLIFPGLKESRGDNKVFDMMTDNTEHGSYRKEHKISYRYVIGSSVLAGTV